MAHVIIVSITLSIVSCWAQVSINHMGDCQNDVPFWVPIIIRGLIEGTQKGTIILTIPHICIYLYEP